MMRHLLACRWGHLIDTRAHDDAPFRLACASGNTHAVRFTLQLQGVRFMDNQRALQDVFVAACARGAVHVVHELLQCTGSRRVDVAANAHEAFLAACENSHVQVMECLLNLQDGRIAATRVTLSIAFARCVRKRLHAAARCLRRHMAADTHNARQRKISLHRASKQPVHTFRGSTRCTAMGAIPPLVRCEPQDPPPPSDVVAALRRSARLVINALPAQSQTQPWNAATKAPTSSSKPRPVLCIVTA
mgnify:CR=1 FL=1